MTRVLALLGACLLVAAAVLARGAIDDDGGDGGDDSSDDGDLVVACIPELRDACEALGRDVAELRIEDPADTIAAVADGEEIDAWVTLDPWPEIANQSEGRTLFDRDEPVAVTQLRIMTRTSDIPRECPDVPTWTCLVDGIGDRVAVPRTDTALGLLIVADAANAFRPGFAGNELRDDFELLGRLDQLDASERDPAGEMLLLPDPDAAGTTSADAETRMRRSAAAQQFTFWPSDPTGFVAIVIAGPDADRVAGEPDFTSALVDLGWTLDTAAATTGLPSAGVLIALQEVAP